MRLVYLATLFILSAVSPSAVIAARDNCGSIRQRQEIRNLSSAQRTTFINALRTLQSGNKPTVYDNFSKTHYDNRNTAHGYAWFFSWHRAYLRDFEKRLQSINSSIMLPYWYWAYDSQAPEKSPVFTDSYFGGNGQSGSQCVTTGPFSSWAPFYPSNRCLTRSWAGGNTIPAFTSIDGINSILSASRSYDDLRNRIEPNPHGSVHVLIGADMSTMYSPNDPIFFLHHAYIDKIWADWQARSSSNAGSYNGPNSDGSTARITDRLPPSTYTVQDVLRTTNLCYTYAPFQIPRVTSSPQLTRRADGDGSENNGTVSSNSTSNSTASSNTTSSDSGTPTGNTTSNGTTSSGGVVVGPVTAAPSPSSPIPPPPEDRKELIALRAPKPLPESWISENNLNVQTVRQYESEQASFVSRLNTIPGYVSPCALLRRPKVLAEIATPGTELTATKAGRKVNIKLPDAPITNGTVQNVVTQVDDKLGTSESKKPADTNDKVVQLTGGPITPS